MLKFFPTALFFVLSNFVAPARAETPTLLFTAIPLQDEATLSQRFGRLAPYLENKLGIQVRYVPARSYPRAVKAFVENDVQLAWFGGYTGLQARQAVPGSEAIVQSVLDTHFKSYFIANVSAGLSPSDNLPSEIRGKTFTFGAPDSTSGFLMPEYFIRQRFGTGPKEVFSRVGFSGGHASTLQLVQSGDVEAGALDFAVYEAKKKAGEVDENKVKVIWKSPDFLDYQFSIRGDVDETFGKGFKGKVKQALLDLDDKEILRFFGDSKFIPANNGQYKPIEDVARLAEATALSTAALKITAVARPPLTNAQDQDGGVALKILTGALRAAGVPVSIQWAYGERALLDGLSSKTADVGLFWQTPNCDRPKSETEAELCDEAALTDPLMQAVIAVVTRSDMPLDPTGPDAAQTRTLCAPESQTLPDEAVAAIPWIKAASDKTGRLKTKAASVKTLRPKTLIDCLGAVGRREADAAITLEPEARLTLEKVKLSQFFRISQAPGVTSGLHVVVSNDNPRQTQLLQTINEAVAKFKSSGAYSAVMAPPPAKLTGASVNPTKPAGASVKQPPQVSGPSRAR
jgi:phosphonate transport system substrate-binding protein